MQTCYSGNSENVISAVNIYFESSIDGFESAITPAQVLIKFLHYYAFEFDPKINAVDISQMIGGQGDLFLGNSVVDRTQLLNHLKAEFNDRKYLQYIQCFENEE